MWVTPGGAIVAATDARLIDPEAPMVTWAMGTAPKAAPLARRGRAHCPLGVFDRLNQLAARTYAPETEARRHSGAGETTPGRD